MRPSRICWPSLTVSASPSKWRSPASTERRSTRCCAPYSASNVPSAPSFSTTSSPLPVATHTRSKRCCARLRPTAISPASRRPSTRCPSQLCPYPEASATPFRAASKRSAPRPGGSYHSPPWPAFGSTSAYCKLLTRLEEDDLLTVIKELIDVQILVEETADSFAFRNALTRHAVYGSLLARERRTLHRRIGDAIEQWRRRAQQAPPQPRLPLLRGRSMGARPRLL